MRLTTYDLIAIVCVNVGSFVAIWIILRWIWKPLESQNQETENESLLEVERQSAKTSIRIIHEGEAAGDYSQDWTKTFDIIFVVLMIFFFIINCVFTIWFYPSLWFNGVFWLKNIVVLFIINLTLFIGGLLCRHFCDTDAHGYIITNKNSPFKVNYTKKIQHFAVYLLPLVLIRIKPNSLMEVPESLDLSWLYWFEMLSLLVLIKPIREKFKFFMIQFNSIDRPEDRPYTLLWTVAYNNIPGFLLTIFFRWLYSKTGVDVNLVTIFSLVNTVGDGLAEPIGIYFGKHRYRTKGCFNKTAYQRSYEGSSCVFMSTIIFTSMFWSAFQTRIQFWITIISLPFIMAFTEALSPHTIDACFICAIGGITLFITSHITLTWSS